jgi:flagellar protein FliS
MYNSESDAKYKSISVGTMTPGELVVLLYEEAAFSVNRAIFQINHKKLFDANKSIVKAENIILYLMRILDMRYPVANQLLPLYDFLYSQLVEANVHKDIEQLSKTARLLSELRDTWHEAEIGLCSKQAIASSI